ncbi:alkaline phosphatase family protein [Candidatus Cloacimonadota bacterium]
MPEYNGKSIVNLMSSLQIACGTKPVYPKLKNINSEYLSEKKNILLIVLDGLGYDYIVDYGKGTLFDHHMDTKLTSVFPSTTASAITTFSSGVAPQEHAITGWFMYFREVAAASLILPFCPRYSGVSYELNGIKTDRIFNFPSIYPALKREKYVVTPKYIKNSPYNNYSLKDTERLGYTKLSGFTRSISKIIKKSRGKSFIYAYWPDFDKNCHRYGVNSEPSFRHFKQLDKSLNSLFKRLQGTDTTCIITADHGLIDTIPERVLSTDDFPEFKDMLILPLCGEPRVPYCYVKASRKIDFQNYVEENMSQICDLHTSDSLIKKGYFGLKDENPKLRDRLGDYILIMKENYVLHDWVAGEKPFNFIGYHGNLTSEEMYVPLIKLDL